MPPSHKRKAGAKNEIRADPTLTLSVPAAGRKYFGLGKNASYEAAARGDIPTIKIGKKILRVPVRALERLLDSASSKLEATE